ncbi:MAG: hypothetical protein ACP5NN_05365 [Methanolinea sp.]
MVVNTRSKILSIFIVLMLVLAVPASAAFQFSSFKSNRPDFSSIFSQPGRITPSDLFPAEHFPFSKPTSFVPEYADVNNIDTVTEIEALEIATEHGVKENPCCPGISIWRTNVNVDSGQNLAVWRVAAGHCGPVLYIDRITGDIVKTEYYKCICYCSDTRRE